MSSQPSSVPTLPFQHPVVTGATGFIGSHLLEALTTRPGLEIKAIVRRRSKRVWLAKQNAEVREVDFSQASSWATAIAGADVVFHLAGATAGTVSQLQKANRDNTTALMEACAQQPRPPVVVLVSSVSAGGPSLPHRLRSPAEPAAPLSNYGKSKLAGELAALQFANRVPLTIVRPGIVFGPRDTELVRLLPLITRLGIHPVPGWNDPLISFIHVTDLVDLLVRAAERGQRCAGPEPQNEQGRGVYYAGDPEPVSFSDFARCAGQAVGKRRVFNVRIPFVVAGGAALVSETWHRLIRVRNTFGPDKIREAAATGWAGDVSKTQSELAWQPAVPIRERFAEFARQWRYGTA